MRNFFVKLASFLMAALFLFSASAEAAVVQCGDTIYYQPSELTNQGNIINVEWQQSFQQRGADYVEIAAVDKDNKAFFPLFVEKSKMPEFQKQSQCDDAKGICTVNVGSQFQYGQNNEQTFRFLVYHNKSDKPFQHRFVTKNTFVKFAKSADNLANSAIVDTVGTFLPGVAQGQKIMSKAIEFGQAFIGNYLRDC